MKYLKTFERYKFIDILELQDLEKEISYIEEIFKSQRPLEVFDCLVDLEDLVQNFSLGNLIPVILEPSTLRQIRCLGQNSGQAELFLTTNNYHDKTSSVFDSGNIKIINSALIGISMEHQQVNWQSALDNQTVASYFKDSIKKECEDFREKVTSGWMPCFSVIVKETNRKNSSKISNDDELIGIMSEMKDKLEGVLNKTIVLAPPPDKLSFLVIDKNFIS